MRYTMQAVLNFVKSIIMPKHERCCSIFIFPVSLLSFMTKLNELFSETGDDEAEALVLAIAAPIIAFVLFSKLNKKE